MTSLDAIRAEIKRLYETNPNIHMNVSMINPRVTLSNEPVIIKGVYPHIFQIEEHSGGTPKNYIIQYADVLTGHIEIAELRIELHN